MTYRFGENTQKTVIWFAPNHTAIAKKAIGDNGATSVVKSISLSKLLSIYFGLSFARFVHIIKSVSQSYLKAGMYFAFSVFIR